MKWIIPTVLALIVVLYVSVAYAQDCFTYTINTADGRLVSCFVCGGIITCN